MPNSFASKSALALFATPDPDYEMRREPANQAAKAFLARWTEQANNGDLVIGKDIPSRAFARYLANLMIVEPVEEGNDCLIRLAGSLVRRRYGREVSGERLSALFSQTAFKQNVVRMQAVRETGSPSVLVGTVRQDDAPPLRFDAIILGAWAPKNDAMWNVVGIFVHTE